MNIEIPTVLYLILGIFIWTILYTRSQKKIKLITDLIALVIWLATTIIYGREIIKQFWFSLLIILLTIILGLVIGRMLNANKKTPKTPIG